MSKIIDDLKPEEARPLQRKLNRRLSEFMDFSVEVWEKTRVAELKEKLRETTNSERRREIQESIQKVPSAAQQVKTKIPKIEMEVYTRDFGDNCYVINMKGEFKLPDFTFPATNLQACLRNGNAVVFIGLGGNYTDAQSKKSLTFSSLRWMPGPHSSGSRSTGRWHASDPLREINIGTPLSSFAPQRF